MTTQEDVERAFDRHVVVTETGLRLKGEFFEYSGKQCYVVELREAIPRETVREHIGYTCEVDGHPMNIVAIESHCVFEVWKLGLYVEEFGDSTGVP